MLLWNCLWIGALAGAVASRLMRGPGGSAPLAVGVLGALLGGLVGSHVEAFPHADLAVAGAGAAVALAAWVAVREVAAGQREDAGMRPEARSAARRG